MTKTTIQQFVHIAVLFIAVLFVIPFGFANIEVLDTDPAPILAGDYADITIRFTQSMLTDFDVPAEENVELKILDTTYSRGSNTEVFAKVYGGDTFTRTFRIYFSEDTPQGTLRLPVEVAYEGYVTEYDVEVFVKEAESMPQLVIGSIEATPDELLVDTDDNKLLVTIQNLGEKDAELVRAVLTATDDAITPSYSYSDSDSVSSIDAGSEAELEFVIDIAFPEEDRIPSQLQLTYRAQNAAGTSYDTFSNMIKFDLVLSESPFLEASHEKMVFEQGSSSNTVAVTVTNTGEDDAKEVRIRLIPDISYPFVFETTTEYVSSKIEPGESATVFFNTDVLVDADVRDYPITVKLESLSGNSRYTQEDSVTVSVSERPNVSPNSMGITIIVIILIVSVIIGFFTWKNKKK